MNTPGRPGFPLISIVTLNYNQAETTIAFLESCKKLRYPNFEILVCDMASGENPAGLINPNSYPNTRLLMCTRNLGFAAGNNWGIRQSNGEYIFIVNNDTILNADTLDVLITPFLLNASIGAVSPKIRYYDNPDIIQYAGFRPMNPFTGRTSSIGDLESDRGQHDQSGVTESAHGCAMMVRKAIIEKTGLFPEKFFLYYEEWDWSARIKKAGFLIWYQAHATVYHKESITVGRESNIKAYYHTRNRILYMRRNSNPFNLIIFTLFFVLFSFPKAVFTYLRKGQLSQLKWFLKGIAYNLTHSSRSKN